MFSCLRFVIFIFSMMPLDNLSMSHNSLLSGRSFFLLISSCLRFSLSFYYFERSFLCQLIFFSRSFFFWFYLIIFSFYFFYHFIFFIFFILFFSSFSFIKLLFLIIFFFSWGSHSSIYVLLFTLLKLCGVVKGNNKKVRYLNIFN